MLRKHLLILMTMAAVAAAAPAAATATTFVPDLPTGLPLPVHQAYIADGDGNPENGHIDLLGYVSLNSSTGLVITCLMDVSMHFYDDGTTWIPFFDGSQCSTNVPGCYGTIEQSLGSWGDRFGYDTNSSSFKDYINVALDVTLHYPGCPVSGTFTETGLLSPGFSVSGGFAHMSFGGASSGTISGPIGSANLSGTLISASGVGSDTQLIY